METSLSGSDSERAEQIVDAAARLSGLPDLAAILQGIAEAALSALAADRVTCHAHRAEDQVVTDVFTTETCPERRALLESNIGKVATRLPICQLQVAQFDPLLIIEDVANDQAVPPAVVERFGSGAVLGVRLEHPSIRAGEGLALLGTLVWIYRHPRRFSTAERQAARGLAGLATLALANARLQEETVQRLEETNMLAAEQAALRRVATRIAAEAVSEVVFAQAAKEVANLLGAQCGVVARFEPDCAVPVGWWGPDRPAGGANFSTQGLGPLAQVARTGRVARVSDYESFADESVGPIARAGRYRSAVAAPVRVGGRLWGVMMAATTNTAPLGPATEGRLERFAELVALGIASAEAQAKLAAQAATDPLTGLANHRFFFERFHGETQRARRHGHPLSLIIIDLDDFKSVNDVHGHLSGDRVLVEAAARLTRLTRDEDTLARIGGEEFAWLLPECDASSAQAAAERARRAIGDEPFATVGSLTMSAGVAEFRPGLSENELFRAADAALYWAKSHGRNRCVAHADDHDLEASGAHLQRTQIERIRSVLDGEGLSIVFQPIVELSGGDVLAAEALCRFATQPHRPPDRWFAEAVEVNLGVELELAALRAALDRIDEVSAGVRLSLNLSPVALCDPRILEEIARVPGSRLAVELTEHAPVANYAALEAALRVPRARGVQLMIDDAGAGFASLKHIVGLHPDVIKLDLSLTRDIDTDPVRRALAAALVAFARDIGAIIVAEGIETRGELEALRALGVTHGQGYHLAPPGSGPVPDRLPLQERTDPGRHEGRTPCRAAEPVTGPVATPWAEVVGERR